MSKKDRGFRRNLNLGMFVVVSLVMLTFLSIRLRGGFGLGAQDTWTAYFGRESSVRKDSEIFVSGTNVGRVTEVSLVPDEEIAPGRHVKVTLAIKKDLTLWEDAAVVLRARGLLGRTVLELFRGTPGRPVMTPDQPLAGRLAASPFDGLASLIEDNRANLQRFTSDLAAVGERLRRGEGTAGRLFADDALYRKVDRIAENLVALTDAARSPDTSFGRLLQDRELFDRLLSSVENLEGITVQIRSGKGTVGRLLYDEKLGDELAETVMRVRNLSRSLEEGEGTLGKLLTDDTLHTALLETVQSLRGLAVRIQKGEGSLSKLLDDEGRLYDNFRLLSENLRLMSDDLRDGKGSLGLFLRDESLYRELQRTFESFRETGEIARENAPLASLVSFTALFFNVLN